ncbi:MAG: lytic murein transglycosylase [Reyranellaceae bacterium]
MNRVAALLLLAGLSGCAAQAQQNTTVTGSGLDASGQPVSAALDETAFRACVLNLQSDAVSRGIPQTVVQRAFAGVATADARVIELDRRQPEFLLTFWRYVGNSVTEDRIARGRQLMAQHGALLQRVQAQYGVQPEVLVAFWGLESNFGAIMGDFPTVRSLATLACDERRAQFFANELNEALRMIAFDRIDPAIMKGSWAGAFGNTQFMPSTFTAHAVDYDGDGRRDLFRSLPDVFASSANFLQKSGWRGGEGAAYEVILPPNFPFDQADPSIEKSNAEWAALGVRRVDGRPLGAPDGRSAIGLPAGHRGPAFLLLPNFKVIMRWNRSLLYGLAVSILSERLAGRPGMSAVQTWDEPPLSATDIVEMQDILRRLGHYPDPSDGLVGPKTRAAIRTYQASANLPQDGFPDQDLMSRLRAAR